MELKEPRPKRYKTKRVVQDTSKAKMTGFFNEFCVVVENTADVQGIVGGECFGKGNLSRALPHRDSFDNTPIIRKRQFECRKNLEKNLFLNKKRKVIVLPDSDSENEDYFKRLKPEFQLVSNIFEETINMSTAEAFYLLKHKNCLNVMYLNKLLNEEECWETFCKSNMYFVQEYICYRHFKLKNWVVKPAAKFGGDFLLYKDGPMYYHASYVVIIDIIDENTLERRNDLCKRAMDAPNVIGLNRLCETIGKELLIFQILWPKDAEIKQHSVIDGIKTNEILMRRWDPNAERTTKTNT